MISPARTGQIAVGIALPLIVIALLAVAGHSSVTDTTTQRAARGPGTIKRTARRAASLATKLP